MNIFMKHFSTRIADGIFHIEDENACSLYVVEGTQKALVIDTGVSDGVKIMPLIRKLSDKPVELAATHGHLDHIGHMDEFETVYMSHRELQIPKESFGALTGIKKEEIERTRNITSKDVIDLGENSVEVFEVPGHSPGSVVFLEKKNGYLFTGDAIGSGCGVWMQLPGSLKLSEYRESLLRFRKWLVEQNRALKFFGGHNFQQFQSPLVPGHNPLSIGLVCDLTDLVEKLLSGEIVGRDANVDKTFSLEPTLYAGYGRAEILYNRSSLVG